MSSERESLALRAPVAPDPYVTLCADYHRARAAVDASGPHDEADAFVAWGKADAGLIAHRATTAAGALAGLKIARKEFVDSYGDEDGVDIDRLILGLLDSAIAVLEREAAHG